MSRANNDHDAPLVDEVRFACILISDRIRAFYRSQRRKGFSRRDVDLLTMGLVLGTGEGVVAYAPKNRSVGDLLRRHIDDSGSVR